MRELTFVLEDEELYSIIETEAKDSGRTIQDNRRSECVETLWSSPGWSTEMDGGWRSARGGVNS